MEGYIAEIRLFGGNFAPRNWAFCDGQLLAVSQNTALFSLLGTTYGGDGRTTFALPDLRGRSPIGPRQGPGLGNHPLGSRGGSEITTLSVANLPPHRHTISPTATNGRIGTNRPENAIPARGGSYAYPTPGTDIEMAPIASELTGNGQAFTNRSPYIAINYIICMFGIFPSRD